MISIVAAMDRNRLIGYGGAIPWKNSTDMKRFRELTTGSTIIMGRKTFESIGRPLPKRINLVVSRDSERFRQLLGFGPSSLQEAVEIAIDLKQPIWIIGGAEIYRQGFEFADTVDLTIVDIEVPIEDESLAVRFPEIPEQFKLVSSEVNREDGMLTHYKYCYAVANAGTT